MMNEDRFTQHEAEIANLVRTTVQAATQPAVGQLHDLMPSPPKSKKATGRFSAALTWQRHWAAAAVCFCLVLGSFGFYLGYPTGGDGIGPAAPTLLAVTATTTEEPTSTLAYEEGELQPVITAVATQPAAAPVHIATPAPNPTPIAALVPIVSSN